MPSVRENFRAMPYQEVGEALEIVRATRASMSAKACLEFVILTACRSGEARNAEWSEINLRIPKEWRIPASRMKSGKEHRQPLSQNEAMARCLNKCIRFPVARVLCFPSPVRKGKPLSRYESDEGFEGHGPFGEMRGAWFPLIVQDVGEREHERLSCRHGIISRPCRRLIRRAGICALRPLRQASAAHGVVGSFRGRWRTREGCETPWIRPRMSSSRRPSFYWTALKIFVRRILRKAWSSFISSSPPRAVRNISAPS